MSKSAVLLGLLAAWGLLLPSAHSQDPRAGVIYFQQRQFKIPVVVGQGPRPKQFNLFVSADQGRTWQQYASGPPEQGHFGFLTDRDGMFWFAVQQVNADGQMVPPNMLSAQPSLKVIIDSTPPVIQLQPLPPRQGEVGVAWNVHDDNLDVRGDAIRLEYRTNGGQWLVLPVTPTMTQYYWNPQGNGVVDVRLRARDRAENWGEATTAVSLTGNPAPQQPLSPNTPRSGIGPGEELRLVNNKRIVLGYDLHEVGPSGVSALELWYTQDGSSWNKHPAPKPDPNPKATALVVEVNGEGVYGFTLLAKSGVGLGVRPPQIGDRPQVWVEVDMTKPEVKLYNVIVGQDEDKGKLTVTWSAKDRNLNAQPITLSYAEQAAGPWTPIEKNLPNSGRYVWTMPKVPYQFFVKVEAVDRAGNIGEAVTENLIKVDLAHPKAKITNVGPAGS
jgi:hypothetical protein